MEIDSITLAGLEAKKVVGYQLQDMSSAFKLVDRKVLIPKLRMIGCSKAVCALMDSYMQGRKNSVKVGEFVTDPVDVKTGVDEGSVLGPIIFLIQILEVSLVMTIVKEKLQNQPDLLASTDLKTVQGHACPNKAPLNQTRYVQMSLTRRIINDDACPHTLAYLVRPNLRFKSQELKSSFPIATRHDPISLFHCGPQST